ncbi:MAG: hypothetical protein GY804_06055 [Alphaproteobacteria bacterium]|nr:hypothetical protein [Alphaproteobacteria bacterium]
MIRYILFAVILVVSIAATVWLVSNPGDVAISWLGWQIDTYVPVLIGAVAFIAAFSTVATLVLRALIRLPKNVSNAISSGSVRRKGIKASEAEKEESKRLFAGFAAVWAGNHMAVDKLYDKYWKKTLASNGEKTSVECGAEILQILLFAKCSEDRGYIDKAIEAYKRLLFFTDVPRDFGIDEKTIHLAAYKGLIFCEHSDARKLEYACEAFAIAPEVPWGAKAVVELQVLTNQWVDAYKLLKGEVSASMNAGKYSSVKLKDYVSNAFGAEEYIKIYAMVTLQVVNEIESMDFDENSNGGVLSDEYTFLASLDTKALLKSVYEYDNYYVPAIVLLAQHYTKIGKKKRAVALLVDAWKQEPDMDIAHAYMNLFDGGKNSEKLSYVEKLAEANPKHQLSLLLLADIGFDINSWEYGKEKLDEYVDAYGLDDTVILAMSRYSIEHDGYNDFAEWLEKHSL